MNTPKLHITGRLWWECTGDQWPSQKVNNACSLFVNLLKGWYTIFNNENIDILQQNRSHMLPPEYV